ncbi:MAG: hypothetical protein GW855_08930 [Erythrobacter sp.]|nr:hypothetical protein [Erythrobacter sp.]NCQ63342.1 hypothetical protein [Alphaproteobacteria bacterium]
MRKHLIAPFALVTTAFGLLASPAHATGGMDCQTASDPHITISVGFGHTAGASLFSQRLYVADREIPVLAPQWWLDGEELRLLLTDEQANERVAVVKAVRNGETYDGSVTYQGKRHWIRCREG